MITSFLPGLEMNWLQAKSIFISSSHSHRAPAYLGELSYLIFLSVCALKVNLLLCHHIRPKEWTLLWINTKPHVWVWRNIAYVVLIADYETEDNPIVIHISTAIAVSLWDNVGQCALPWSIICPAVNSLWQNPSFLLSAPRNQHCPWTLANWILPLWTPEKLSSLCCKKENKRVTENENS